MQTIELKTMKEVKEIVRKLEEDHKSALRMKRENQRLRKKIEALMKNNQNMAAIIRKLDNKMEEAHFLPKEKYRYSYQDGMMIRKEEVNRKRLELKKKSADMNEVNKQLNEILEIMKKRNINIDPDDNNKDSV